MNDSPLPVLLIAPLLLAGSAVICALEVAFLYASRARLYQLSCQGNARARQVLDIMQHPDLMLATLTLVLNTLNIAASALVTLLLVNLFGELGVAYATAAMSVAVFVVSEALPKAVGTRFPEAIAMAFAPLVWLLEKILWPVTWPVKLFNNGLMNLLGLNAKNRQLFTEGDLRGAISLGLEYGTIHKTEFRMLDAVLGLDDRTVTDVMVHRDAIVSLDVKTPPANIPKLLGHCNHTHVPVYEGRPDNFIGILGIRDYITALGQTPKRADIVLKKILRPVYEVPEITRLSHQLFEFSKDKNRHMALVVDTARRLKGLLTLQDILEEIIGNASYENDSPPVTQKLEADGSVTLPGRCAVIDVNKAFRWQLPIDEAVTIAGLIVEEMGRLPAQGESIVIGNKRFTVVYKFGHRVETVKITPIK